MSDQAWYESRSASALKVVEDELSPLLEVGGELFQLHRGAIEVVAGSQSGFNTADPDLLAITCHSLNAYVAAMRFAALGMADVGFYLLRPLYEIQSFVMALLTPGLSPEANERASSWRKSFIDFLGQWGQSELGTDLDPLMAANGKFFDKYAAHFGPRHLEALSADTIDGKLEPTVLGNSAIEPAYELGVKVLLLEFQILNYLRAEAHLSTNAEWLRKLERVRSQAEEIRSEFELASRPSSPPKEPFVSPPPQPP